MILKVFLIFENSIITIKNSLPAIVNAHDSKDDIDEFYERNSPLFKTVSDEKGKVTTNFGIDAFPQIVLIDKESKVIYAGRIDIDRLEEILKAVL